MLDCKLNFLTIIMNCDLFCTISPDLFYPESGVTIYQSVFFSKEKVRIVRKFIRKGKIGKH